MMNKRIRSMVDEIFSQMQMTAENLALRDELLANAQARYEDVVGGGKSEEEAFAEVAVSLEDVHELLREMNGGAAQESAQAEKTPKEQEEPADEPAEEEPEAEQPQANDKADIDLGETLNKAFSALGSFGKSIMPQAKKLVREVDNATGGALKSVGKAVNKTMKDAQKVAGDAIDKMSDKSGELVFDFGKREEPKAQEERDPDLLRTDARTLREEALELREEAADLRAEAGFKKVTGDQSGADELNAKADALEAQAGGLDAQADGLNVQADMLEQAQAMEDAAKAAAEEAAAQVEDPAADEPIILEEKHAPLMDMDGDVNEDVFTRVVEQIELETERVLGDEPAQEEAWEEAQDAEYTVKDEATSERKLMFPAAGLRTVDIELDADDVRIESCEGSLIETVWSAQHVEGEPEIVMEGHKLKIRRRNPDVFKTFFSAFSKNGGKITVRVPHGYAADYKINTTSGDIVLDEVDMESAKVNTASGSIRLEPDAAVRVQQIKANTVSGNVNVSACAEDVKVNTVSGELRISCDAQKVSAASVSGRIYAEGACDIWDVDSVSGSVELVCTAVPGKKIQVDTVSASASVALPGSIRGFVAEVSGVSGKLVNEFGPNRYGTCALPIRMNSMSGSMKITKL